MNECPKGGPHLWSVYLNPGNGHFITSIIKCVRCELSREDWRNEYKK